MKLTRDITDTLVIRPVFCSKFDFIARNLGWVTQPFPVLAMKTRGSGKTTIAGDAGTIVTEEEMRPYLLPAYVMRKPEVTGAAGYGVLAIGFSVEVLGGIGLLNFFNVPILFRETDTERLRDLMTGLYELGSIPETEDLHQLAVQNKIFFEIFEILMKTAEPKKQGRFLDTGEYGCLPAVEHLKEHFAEPFDLKKLQDICHVSQAHFFRLFKRLTGVSPFTYLKDRRIEEAQKLLLTTDHGVAEIGERVGWHDQFHFSRTFKARTGYSPSQFREQYRIG